MLTQRISRLLLCLLLATTSVCVTARIAYTTATVGLERLLASYGFSETDIGYALFDPFDGRLLEEHRADEPRIPASTTKVVTTVAALQILGPEYRFTTSLFTSGKVRGKTLQGSVYLHGGGDPTLTTDDLREVAAALNRAGITQVTGAFGFDESFLFSMNEIDTRQPLAASYNPGLSALSVNYNRIQLRWKRNKGSAAFAATAVSVADGGLIPLEAITTGALPRGVDRRIAFLPDGAALDRWLLAPTLPARGKAMLPVKTAPGRITALLFHTLCQQQGIELPPPQSATVPQDAQLLYAHHSRPLATIVAGTLYYSNNLSAELIGQVATRTLWGRPLSLQESASTLAAWYRRTLSASDWRGFVSANHSGLSTATRHTPRQMAAILRHGWTLPVGRSRFSQLLASPPWVQRENEAPRAIKAKSGTLSYADGLVGYMTTTHGRQLGFVILLTDFARRAALDATLDVRIIDPPPAAVAWTNRAKALEHALVTNWKTRY
jgi:D-alanyl-D-alanine carboxypeptidase/D-alanyl-D-alanine-endopeptidase (penicillin-binding protein 4)